MSARLPNGAQWVEQASEPILNVPPVVTATLVALALVHAIRVFGLSPAQDLDFLLLFSFIPARYDGALINHATVPGGLGADVWTFITYALIHGDITHLGINAVWLLAFGSALARRFGPMRFLVFSAVTAAAGAAMHLLTHPGEFAPMVGASAAISGQMAAAIRFVFQGGGPVELWRAQRARGYAVPAAPLVAVFSDPRILAFLAVWFGLNILLGVGSVSIAGNEEVAWQAHIGGFLAGLLIFALFDPVKD
jgi:membrane associated rhomboid family serine protease